MRIGIGVVLWGLLAALLSVEWAAASGPERVREPIEREIVSPRLTTACGFPVRVRQEGYRDSKLFYDEDGNISREILHDASFTNTWTNLETGTTVASPHPIVARTTYRADGSSVVAVSGLEFNIASPGAGVIATSAGRRVWEFDPAGDFLGTLFAAGPADELLPALCLALSAESQ